MLSFVRNFWKKSYKPEVDSLRYTIEDLIEETQEESSSIDSDEIVLLENVLNLRDLEAKDVMITRTDVIALPFETPVDEIIDLVIKNNLTAIPLYRDNLDNIIGVVHIKDLLAWIHKGKVVEFKTLLRPVMFISPTMRTLDLLIQMRESGAKMAFVIDEYGGVDGLVTFSRVIGEVIGDIKDATYYSNKQSKIEIAKDGTVIANGRTPLEEVNEALDHKIDINEESENIDTIGGLVVFFAGRVPVRGEIIKHPNGFEFEILEADPRKINRLSIRYDKVHQLN
jgi:magnesium and cobalt transporter